MAGNGMRKTNLDCPFLCEPFEDEEHDINCLAWDDSWSFAQDFEDDSLPSMSPEDSTTKENVSLPSGLPLLPVPTTKAGQAPRSLSPANWFSSWCEHSQDPYRLSDGTLILLTAHRDRQGTTKPDRACYFDKAWSADCPAYFVPWQDFGLPALSDPDFVVVLRDVLAWCREGLRTEIGCLGAHGRTGTFLACLEVLANEGMSPADAIARVRHEHCSSAIESKEQEWYVSAIAAYLRGTEVPPKPVAPKPKPFKGTKPAKATKGQGKGTKTANNGTGKAVKAVTYDGMTGKRKRNRKA